MSLLDVILPPGVFNVVHDPQWPHDLVPAEEEVCRLASSKRRAEFAAGRTCARRALRSVGHDGWPLLPGPGRAPIWPDGIVGSITHTDGFVAAAVATTDCIQGLGIDAEQRVALPEGVAESVCTPKESAWCWDQIRRTDECWWDTLIFSAKESVYKAWYPHTGAWLDYDDVDLELVADFGHAGCFRAVEIRSLALPPGLAIVGRYLVDGDLILTSAQLQGMSGT